ncbi:hypothetical protein EJ06DRAFT_583308 [Trichodelitschia bisporula]|uniref:Mitochondrial import inner membrane translocase subunit n=1 Tax=Trichodelitschia bisporula TaxID=703511 RepID=A0A6G1HS20_9PEZI|nr:hypothetical protein EJ06DRAFT_583308 [Trichodelitschia bisporula]
MSTFRRQDGARSSTFSELRLTSAEQHELGQRMERKQIRAFMEMYQNLVTRCFDDCITDFSTKSLGSREENCVLRCVDKQIKSQERLSARFQEQNAAMAQQGSLGR